MKKFYSFLTLLACFICFSVKAEVPIQEWDTSRNIHVIYVPDPTTHLVTVSFSFKGVGASVDPKGQEGLGALMLQLMFERTDEGSDRYALEKKLKQLGVLEGIHQQITHDNIHFSFKCPQAKIKDVFQIIKTIFMTPSFDAKELAKMKNFDPANARLSSSGEQAFARKILLQKIFSPHAYSTPASGTLDGRQSITVEDIKNSFFSRFSRDRLVFSVVGNLSPTQLTDCIDNTFGVLPAKNSLLIDSKVPLNIDGQITVIPKDTPQSGVVFAQQGLSVNDKDYLAFLIVNDILGGKPFTSRLWLDARENKGLVYSIQTDPMVYRFATLWFGAFESDNTKVKEVIAIIRQEWNNVKGTGISEAEFKASKAGLSGSFVLNFTTPEGIAHMLMHCYLSGLSPQYVNQRNKLLEAVSLADVNRVAKTLLTPEKLTFVVVGNL
jgi:zinc protease